MINLDTTTLVIVDTKQPHIAVKALEKTCEKLKFKRVVLFSDKKPFNFNNKFEFIQIKSISDLMEYSKFMVNELPNFIDTEHCFTIHHDGFVINPENWSNDFLNYDWIGAPWKKDAHFLVNGERVGNGGVSIRSKKLMDIAKKYECNNHEDTFICCSLRNILTENGIKFAPLDLAAKFSLECGSEDLNVTINDVFAFHGKHSKEHNNCIRDIIFKYYKEDLIKMDQDRLKDWIRNEAGSSEPSYFYCNTPGNLTLQQIPEEYSELLNIFKNSNIQSYLELGVANGGSFFVNSIFLQNTAEKLYCVDNLAYKDTHVKQTAEKILSKVNKLKELFKEKDIKFYNSTTDEYFKGTKDTFDCIFIDADHSYEGVKKDFENSLNHLNDNGILVFHDIANADTGVKKLWEEIKDNFKDSKEFTFTKANWYNCGIGVIYV
jgi:predicted O-methyltransferase YrrM